MVKTRRKPRSKSKPKYARKNQNRRSKGKRHRRKTQNRRSKGKCHRRKTNRRKRKMHGGFNVTDITSGFTSSLGGLQNTLVSKFNNVQSQITNRIGSIKDNASNRYNNIKSCLGHGGKETKEHKEPISNSSV